MSHAFTCYVACDALRTDGSPARMTLAVPCELEDVGPLPTAGEFVLHDDRRVRYFGHKGAAFLGLERPGSERNELSILLGDHFRGAGVLPVPLAVDGRLHRVTRSPVTDRMLDGYVNADDPKVRSCYRDAGTIDTTAAEARKVVAQEAVVSEGRVLVRKPPPVWKAMPFWPAVQLKMRSNIRSEVNGMDEFAAHRIDAAGAYCSAMGQNMRLPRLQFGRVEFLDPSYMEADDLVDVAARAGSFVASQLSCDLPSMPSWMVKRWYDAAQASASLESGETWRTGEILRGVADLMNYAEDPGNDCTVRREGRLRDSKRQWEAHRRRIFEIEGIEPSLLIEERPGIAPGGSRS